MAILSKISHMRPLHLSGHMNSLWSIIYGKYMQGTIEILSTNSQIQLEMVQSDITHSCKNDIQRDDTQFNDQPVPTDHTNTPSMFKGDDEHIVGDLIEEEFNFEPYQPMVPVPRRLSQSHWEILNKEDSKESLSNFIFNPSSSKNRKLVEGASLSPFLF